jgi:RHS repeat-associated protein
MIKFSKKTARIVAAAMFLFNPVLDLVAQNPQVIDIPAGTGCSPRTNSINISNSSNVNVMFDLPMNNQGWQDNIRVYSNYRGYLQYWGRGTFNHTSPSPQVNFTPTNPYHYGENVNVIVKGGTATNNNPLIDPKSFNFNAATNTANALFTAQNNTVPTNKIPIYVIAADFNSDGFVDVGTLETGGWFYYIKNVAGGVSVINNYSINNGISFFPNSMCPLDYDMDGDIDIVFAGNDGLRILQNLGSGSFSLGSVISNGVPGSYSMEIVTNDFNNDGFYDVATLNSSGRLEIFLNNSGAGFNSPLTYSISSSSMDLAAGDFDNDGKVDLTYIDPSTALVYFMRNTSTGVLTSFQFIASYSSTATSQLLRIAPIDVDNDFDLDLVALYGSGNPPSDNVVIFRNNGTGVFSASPSDIYPTQSIIRQNHICVSDYDGDGDQDFIIASHEYLSNQIEVFINNAGCGGGTIGSFTSNLQTPTNTPNDPEGFGGLATADFNGDGKMDLAGGMIGNNGYTQLFLNGGSCSVSGNINPSICPIVNQDICKDFTTVIPFCIDDVESNYSQLSYNVTSSTAGITASIAPIGVIGANDPGAYPMALSVTASGVSVGTQSTITITVTDGNGGQATLSFVVTVVTNGGSSPVQVSISVNPNTTICHNTPITLTANVTNGGGAPTYQWAVDDGTAFINVPGATFQTFVFTPPLQPGVTSYKIRCWVVSNQICVTGNPAFADTKVSVHDVIPFELMPPNKTICQGECVFIDAQDGVNLGYQGFIWTPDYAITANNGSSITACPPFSTIYSVTALDMNGCSYTATSNITVLPNPMIPQTPSLNPPNNTGWNHCYANKSFDRAYSGQAFRATDDGGFLYVINTKSDIGGDITQFPPISGAADTDLDILFQRYDQGHALVSERRIGGTDDDEVYCIKKSVLGGQNGFVIVGSTKSSSHYNIVGGKDIYIAYLDLLGNPVWETTYGGLYDDIAYSVEETFDGYVLVGKISDPGGDKTTIIKFDFTGNPVPLWEHNFPSPDYSFYAISKSGITDFIIAGGRNDDKDFYLRKINYNGGIVWEQTYSIDPNGLREAAYSVKQTSDGGYAFLGVAEIGSPDFSQRLFKTDDLGYLLWDKFAGDYDAHAEITPDLEVDYDDGYLIASTEIDPTFKDYRIYKFDNAGTLLWTHDVVGNNEDIGSAIRRSTLGVVMGMGATISSDFSNDYDVDEDVLVFDLKFNESCGPLFNDYNVCQGGSLNIIANIPVGATNITWLIDGQSMGNPSTSYTFLLADDPGIPRNNLVSLSYEYNGCTFYCEQDINVTIGATVNAGADQTICPGQTANLLASGSGTAFQWSNSVSGASNPVSPNQTTTYTVTVTNANGCTAEDNVTVNVTNLTVNITPPNQTVCSGSSVVLTANVNGTWSPTPTYLWSTGATTASITASSSSTTTYSVTVTSGVCVGNASVTINTNPLPAINVTGTIGVSCIGRNDGGVSFTVSNSSNYSYTITGNGVNIPGNGTGSTTVSNALGQGTYTLTVIDLSNPTHCQNNTTFTVGYGGPQFSVCASVLDCGSSSGSVTINFNVTRQNPSTSDPYSYTVTENTPTGTQVYNGNGVLNTLTSQSVPGLNAGQTYYVNVTDNSGCLVSSSFTVQALQFFASTNSDFPICNTGSTIEISPLNLWSNASACSSIDVTYNVIIKKKDAGNVYSIQVYSYTVASTSLPIVSPNLPVLGIGEYEITVGMSGPNSTNCTVQPFYFTVSATSPITVNVQTTMPLCFGGQDGSATANVTGGSGSLTYQWYNATPTAPAIPTGLGSSLPGNGYSVSNLPYGNYAVVVTDPNSGCTATQPVFFTVEQPLEFELLDPPGCTSTACSASVSVQGGTPGYTFSWQHFKTIESVNVSITQNPGNVLGTVTDPLDDPLNGFLVAQYDPQNPPANFALNTVYYNTTSGTYQQFVEVFVDHVTPAQGLFEGTSVYNNPEPGTYQIIATDANGCSFLVCTLEVVHPATPRTYAICFNWKTRSTEESDPTDPTQTINLAALAASDISQAIDNAVQECIVKQTSSITQGVLEMCNKLDYLEDELALTYKLKQQHYTLYYYDRAGNLVRTVPPEGFVASADRSPTTHGLVTKYHYNSLAQLVNQTTPDGGTTKFLYNDLNQLLYSQNAEQLATARHPNPEFSYTRYDELGRIVEVGKSQGTFDESLLTNPSPLGITTEQTFTVYSDASSNINYQGRMQRYLQNRVSYSFNVDNTGNNNYTYYSYDPHGNVEWLVQDIAGFGKSTVAYEYDLISNKVLKVSFNEGRIDQYYHRYRYDEDNRILGMETSKDGYLWDNDASYSYYDHGPLRRTEIGHDKIQGLDYTYTLQGWLKGINSPHLSIDAAMNGNIDYGNDGTTGNAFAPDEFGMALGYYKGDFNRSGMHSFLNSDNANPFYLEALTTGTNGQAYAGNLYNGNISTWLYNVSTQSPTGSGYTPQLVGEQYTYDRLNRIKSSTYNTFDDGTNEYINPDDKFRTTYTYDANGNIKKLTRNDMLGDMFDELSYNYNNGTNQLNYVTDGQPDAASTVDIDNQSSNNYKYDFIGNLIRDEQEKLGDDANNVDGIKWTVYGKISEVIPKNTNGVDQKPYLKFTYDATGNRIAKHVIAHPYADVLFVPNPSQLIPNSEDFNPVDVTTTYYVRDASGNIMAIYERTNIANTAADNSIYYTAQFKQIEVDLYGSDRVGTYNPADLIVGSVNFLPGQFYNVGLSFDNYSRVTEFTDPFTNSHKDDYFDTDVNNQNNILISTVAINRIDFGVPDITPKVEFLGATDNSIAQAETDANISNVFYAVGANYWGNSNTLLVYDRENNLMAGSNNIVTTCDEKSKPVITQKPGTDSKIYYLFTRDASGALFYYTIDMDLPGNGDASNKLGEITAQNLLSSAICGRHMAVIEDNVNNLSYVYFTEHSNGTGQTSLKRIVINQLGTYLIEDLITYTSYDENGDGEIQIAPDGSSLTIYNHLLALGWFNASEAEIISYKLSSNYGIAYAANVQNNNAWEPQKTIISLPDNNCPKGTLDYTADGLTITYAQSAIQNLGGGLTPYNIVKTVDLSNTNNNYTVNDARVGDIRHFATASGSTSPNYHFEKGGVNADAWVNDAIYTHPSPGSTTTALTSLGTNQFLDAALPTQPHKVFAVTLNELITNRIVGKKLYELKDHLGNVRLTVSDAKQGPSLADLKAEVMGINNYYPFGMLMQGRNYQAGYRFGFNGKEMDNDIKGVGNSYDFGARIYDPRVSRFYSVDPKESNYPWQSPFAYFLNSPIRFLDINGEGGGDDVIHRVTSGESPSSIAKQHGISVWELAKLNQGNLSAGGHFNPVGDGDYQRYFVEGQGTEWSLKPGDVLIVKDPAKIEEDRAKAEKESALAYQQIQNSYEMEILQGEIDYYGKRIEELKGGYEHAQNAFNMSLVGIALEGPGLILKGGKWVWGSVQGAKAVKGVSVIGPRATYREYAKNMGANFLDVTDDAWTWAQNEKFLAGVVKRGDDVVFAGKFNPAKLDPLSILAKEINYLTTNGYRWVDDFSKLVK